MPPHKRRFGYYAMPILAGGTFVGRIDPRLDREQGQLVIRLLQLEASIRPSRQFLRNLRNALMAFAKALGASEVTVERTEPEGLRV